MTTLSQPINAEWWRRLPAAEVRPRSLPHSGSTAPFWALMWLTVVMFLAPQAYAPVLASLRIALLAAAFAFVTFAWDRAKCGQPVFTLTEEGRWCLALVTWAIASVAWSKWAGGSVNLLLDLYLKSVIVFWLLTNIVRSPRALRQTAWTLSLIAVPLALTAITHLLAGDFYPGAQATDERIIGYDAGLVKNPNDLALVLNLLLPLTTALFAIEPTRARRWLLAAIVGCEAGGVVATSSRTGFLTLLVVVGLHLWLFRRLAIVRRIWFAFAVGAFALFMAPGPYLDRMSTILDKDADPTGSAQARWSDQLVAIGYVEDHPITGAGVGSDILVMNDLRGPKWRQVHDLYLEYAVDLGLPGLALFLVLFRKCFKAVTFARRRCADLARAETVASLARGLWISLAGFAIAAFFSPIAYHVYFYYVAGLAAATKATAAGTGEML